MKLKTDFVTNSSSSSFVVAFEQKTTFTYLKDKIMFMEKAMVVWKDCRKQRIQKLTPENDALIERILAETVSGYYPGYNNNEIKEQDFLNENRYSITGRLWDEENRHIREHYYREQDRRRSLGALKPAMEFIKNNMNNYIGFFSYADGDGAFMSEMEHGGTFNRLSCLTISHH